MNHKKGNYRRGASVMELAIVLPLFLMLTLGMVDLGRAVFRYHVLNQAACQGARRAIVHGALADTALEGVWGPTLIDHKRATTTNVPIIDGSGPNAKDGIAGMLVGCDKANTLITVDWNPDGSNGAPSNYAGMNVRVTVSSPYQPFLPFLSGGTLSAASTMQIVH